jgi:hypothetical protein
MLDIFDSIGGVLLQDMRGYFEYYGRGIAAGYPAKALLYFILYTEQSVTLFESYQPGRHGMR